LADEETADDHVPQSYTFKRLRTLERPTGAGVPKKLQQSERPPKDAIHARLTRFGFLRNASKPF
jgi:hypothetical protein